MCIANFFVATHIKLCSRIIYTVVEPIPEISIDFAFLNFYLDITFNKKTVYIVCPTIHKADLIPRGDTHL
jgi:hypothetical protein